MKIAIASGKGGTGKTTVSAALASIWDRPLLAVDLDVEEPNLHLFLNPKISGRQEAFLEIPVVDDRKCTRCGRCSDLCQFKALSLLGDTLVTFPEMCHGCGGCFQVCPENALSCGSRLLGEISWGHTQNADFIMGCLRVGEAMSPPLMREVKAKIAEMYDPHGVDMIIDAPPGVSCPAVNAVMDADAVVLVTEPTPFGLYDLRLACSAFTALGLPLGVVVNRSGAGDDQVYAYCRQTGIEILAEIPFDLKVAEAYSRGEVIVGAAPQIEGIISDLAEKVMYLGRPGKERRCA